MLFKINRKSPSLKLTIKLHLLDKTVRPIVRNTYKWTSIPDS